MMLKLNPKKIKTNFLNKRRRRRRRRRRCWQKWSEENLFTTAVSTRFLTLNSFGLGRGHLTTHKCYFCYCQFLNEKGTTRHCILIRPFLSYCPFNSGKRTWTGRRRLILYTITTPKAMIKSNFLVCYLCWIVWQTTNNKRRRCSREKLISCECARV